MGESLCPNSVGEMLSLDLSPRGFCFVSRMGARALSPKTLSPEVMLQTGPAKASLISVFCFNFCMNMFLVRLR